MTIAWTDDEYGRVAEALNYPRSRTAVVTQGYVQSTIPIGYALDGRLTSLNAGAKVSVLQKADAILQKRRELYDSTSDAPPNVSRVGEIWLDPRKGLENRLAILEEMISDLEAACAFWRNPNIGNGSGSGGINAAVC